MGNKFWLNSITVNKAQQTVDKNYYQSDENFAKAKKRTLNSPAIFGETTNINVFNENASNRDLQARDICCRQRWCNGFSLPARRPLLPRAYSLRR